jgi:hypothetical protein
MANTKQTGAIGAATQLVGLMQQMQSIRASAKAFVDTYNSEAWSAVWNAMATAVPNADGSLGAADGAPNVAHPITVGGINKSATALIAGVTALQDFLNFCQNAVVATAQRSQTIDDLGS